MLVHLVALLVVALLTQRTPLHHQCLLRGALAAHHLAPRTGRQLAAVVYVEATRTGELICLPRQHAQREFFVGKIRARQFERLGEIRLVAFEDATLPVGAACLQLFETVFTKVLVNLARGVVIGRHGNLRCLVILGRACAVLVALSAGSPGVRLSTVNHPRVAARSVTLNSPNLCPLAGRLCRIFTASVSRPAAATPRRPHRPPAVVRVCPVCPDPRAPTMRAWRCGTEGGS